MHSHKMARSTCALVGALVALAQRAQAAQIVGTLPADASADYVIVGGGLGGMVLANRLSAGGAHSVIVLEAGTDARYVDEINDPFLYNTVLTPDGDYDWRYPTVNQTVGGVPKSISGGKALGGSTSINGMDWTRGSVSQYDSIAALNNDSSFSWTEFFPYMKRAEHFYPPSKETLAKGAYFAPAAHGYTGHVGVSFVQPYRGWVLSEALTAAARKVFGLKGGDVTGGDPNVATQIALSVHPAGNTSARSSSAASYLYPLFAPHSNTTHQHPGLTVVPGVQATRIRWAAAGVATGVEYGAANGRGPRMTVRAHKEVLVCAGAIGSPVLLLRSGVGAPTELAKFNITSVIDLPSVGTNLQDQALALIFYNMTAAAAADPARGAPLQSQGNLAFPNLAQLVGPSAASKMVAALNASASARAAAIVHAGGHTSVAGLTRQFELQAQQIAGGAPVGEASTSVLGGYVGAVCWTLLPQYRGTVRLASADPFVYPRIDPAYLTTDYDMSVLTATLRGARALFAVPAVAASVTGEVAPGLAAVPANASDAQWATYINASYHAVYHPIGTVAMAPRADGGAVDTKFRLYGAMNVRVVDASVLPIQLSAHLSATLYGLAEKAAETILRGE